ncbi:MAG TPA: cyclase family protein [Terriglobales bacterium]|nr:cyclase family protein [Terriglobales bacterium]
MMKLLVPLSKRAAFGRLPYRASRVSTLTRSGVRSAAIVVLCMAASAAAGHAPASSAAKTDAPHHLSQSEFDALFKQLSNWGRWGKNDELGTVNLITPQVRLQAVREVRSGISVSLARPISTTPTVDNATPLKDVVAVNVDDKFNMDTYTVSFHGFGLSHFDSLAHTFYKGKLYNGFSESDVTPGGTRRLDAEQYHDGIVTRGVLVDIPQLRGKPYLDTSDVVTAADLDAWERRTAEHIRAGDAVFIRTGRWARRAALGPWDISKASAGLHPDAVRWLKQRDIAVLGSDAAHDALPSYVDGVDFPIHILTIVAMGMPLLDQLDLENVAKTAARLHRTTFLLTFAPPRIQDGTGSLMNPIATF